MSYLKTEEQSDRQTNKDKREPRDITSIQLFRIGLYLTKYKKTIGWICKNIIFQTYHKITNEAHIATFSLSSIKFQSHPQTELC
jgi:hypothetical protein